jgi:hypothetical protein
MRVLWSLIAVLVLVTAIVVVSGRVRAGSGSTSQDPTEPVRVAARTPARTADRAPDPAPSQPVVPPADPDPVILEPETLEPEQPEQPEPPEPPEPDELEPEQPEPDEPDAVEPATPDPQPADTAVATADPPVEQTTPPDTTPAEVTTADPAETLADDLIESSDDRRLEEGEETAEEALADGGGSGPNDPDEAKIVRQDDGSMLVDDRFIVRGAGSKEDPYRVTWEMLVSANETYRPRLGKTELPARIKMLDGKWVKITGYLAFPLAATSIEEALVMLNQWDGCCIGVPPSPYDALETRLSEPLKFDKGHVFQYGTATGMLKIDPYLVNNWLVGLYLLEDAKIEMDL